MAQTGPLAGSPAGLGDGAAEARLRDPAHRDQDGPVWRRDRFAERVRRQWNAVAADGVPLTADDLEPLARAIQAHAGGDVEDVKARLQEFLRMDEAAAPPVADPLVKPGEPI